MTGPPTSAPGEFSAWAPPNLTKRRPESRAPGDRSRTPGDMNEKRQPRDGPPELPGLRLYHALASESTQIMDAGPSCPCTGNPTTESARCQAFFGRWPRGHDRAPRQPAKAVLAAAKRGHHRRPGRGGFMRGYAALAPAAEEARAQPAGGRHHGGARARRPTGGGPPSPGRCRLGSPRVGARRGGRSSCRMGHDLPLGMPRRDCRRGNRAPSTGQGCRHPRQRGARSQAAQTQGARRPAARAAPGRTPHQGRGLAAGPPGGKPALLHKGTAPPAAALPSAGVGRPRAIPFYVGQAACSRPTMGRGPGPSILGQEGPRPTTPGPSRPRDGGPSVPTMGLLRRRTIEGAGPRRSGPGAAWAAAAAARAPEQKTRDSC